MSKITIDNRYKVLNKIGTGATGVVYKVKDLTHNRILALKILSKQKTLSEAVQRFEREFCLLAQLRHPNLCVVYDFGHLMDGRTYFTMEYIDGQDIYKATINASNEKKYEWIVQLCRALEYIHSKGLIHYDIKPGNVLVAKGKEHGATGNKRRNAQSSMLQVKLMDFGLASEQRIKGGTLIKGTFPYIAPEVIKGQAIDWRADLYSLGVLLYEIFTRKSFQEEKKSLVTLLQHRMLRSSELPSRIIIDIPIRLKRLIVRLLNFEPAARYNHANEIIREINRLSHSKFALETEKTIEGYLLSSKFVGRNTEIDLLKTYFEKARNGEGKIVLITGEAGIGKSRLLKEFRIFTQLRRSHCLIGHAYKNKSQALESLYDIFSELINYLGDGYDVKTSLAVLFKIFPDLTNGHLRKNIPKLAPLNPKQEKLRTFEAFSKLIQHCASELGELVILLEDLHWADDLTTQFLEYLGRNIAGKNIFICGTYRKEELAKNLGLKILISSLSNERNFNQVELKPLTFRSLYSFLDSTITPQSNSSELTRYLMKKTGGNPFFVEEVMRALLQKKSVNIGERLVTAHFKNIAIPSTIEKTVLMRIDDLDQSSREIIKFCAVLRKGFNYDLMKRLTGLNNTELSRSLWELRNRQIVVEENNQYSFCHATFRETINKHLRNKEKKTLNERVGRVLEIISRKRSERIVEDLAYYFINAKDHKKGIAYGLQAAKKSSERYANNRAIQFYKGVLGLLDNKNPRLRFDILKRLAYIEIIADYYDDAIKHYNKALSLKVGTIDEVVKTYCGIGGVYFEKGEHYKALPVYRKGLSFLKKMRPGKLKNLIEMDINVRICLSYVQIGDYKKTYKYNFDIQKISKGSKDKRTIRLLGSIYHNLGIVVEHIKGAYGEGDHEKAISYYKEAFKCHKRMKAEDRIAWVLNDIGTCYARMYDLPKAINYFQKSIDASKKIGDQRHVSLVLSNLGISLRNQGYYSKALDCFREAFSIAKKIGNPHLMGISYLQFGQQFLQQSCYRDAKEYLEKAVRVFDNLGWGKTRTEAHSNIGDIYQITGHYTLAMKFYRRALKIFKTFGSQTYVAESLYKIGSLFMLFGEFSRTKKYIEDALVSAIQLELKDLEIECYIILCRMNTLMKIYAVAHKYCRKGETIAKSLGLRRHVLQFLLICSEICYYERKYLRGIKVVYRALKLAKEIDKRDLYVEVLLMKIKYEIALNVLSTKEIATTMDGAIKIAKEIGCPELLWKTYFEYGSILQQKKEYNKALNYYERCIEILINISKLIKNKYHRKSYLARPDRQAVFSAIDTVERLL